MFPAVHRGNVGELTPDDLMMGISIFNALFPPGEDD